MAKIYCCVVLPTLLFLSLVAADTQVKVTDNPADELVDEMNKNRSAATRGSALYSNPGLACIALQYIKAYEGDCGAVGKSKKPQDSQFAETFAPNCGVIASTLAPITGRFISCQSHYAKPEKAFSILMESKESLDLLHSKNHSEVGAAVSGSDGGGPYFWCVLFSNGTKNGSFVAEDGTPKITRPGCFSGANDQCSRAEDSSQTTLFWPLIFAVSLAMGFTFGL